jgi:hypothetical protein
MASNNKKESLVRSVRLPVELLNEWLQGLEAHKIKEAYLLRFLIQAQLEDWRAEDEGLVSFRLLLEPELVARVRSLAKLSHRRNLEDFLLSLIFDAVGQHEKAQKLLHSPTPVDIVGRTQQAVEALRDGDDPLTTLLAYVCDVLPVRGLFLRGIAEPATKTPKLQ